MELIAGSAAAATAASGASTALTVLSGLATVTSILGTLGAADAEARTFEQQARESILEAGQEQLGSQQRKNTMTRELMRVLGENDIAVAAAGIDLAGGDSLGAATARKAKEAATRELSIERQDDEMRRAMIKARASGLRNRAASARTSGGLRALAQGAEFAFDVAERG